MSKPVVTLSELTSVTFSPKEESIFGASVAAVGEALGTKDLGIMQVTVEPGKRAFPYHNHLAADEMFVILEGQGTFRIGNEQHPIAAGDVCYAPKGGPGTAHQIINTGTSMLRYLGISTMPDPDIVEYPDSGKFGVLGVSPGDRFENAHFRYIGRKESKLDYWDGEL